MNAKNTKPLSQARDADARHTVAALHRAAHNARQLAATTRTPLIVVPTADIAAQPGRQAGDAAAAQPQRP